MDTLHLLVAGMSHVHALHDGWLELSSHDPHIRIKFVDLRQQDGNIPVGLKAYENAATHAGAIALLLNGNEHTVVGLANFEPLPTALSKLEEGVRSGMDKWLDRLLPMSDAHTVLLFPPPPIEDVWPIIERKRSMKARNATNPGNVIGGLVDKHGLRPAPDRLAIWRRQCVILAEIAESRGLPIIALPTEVLSPSGMLAPSCCNEANITHGNAEYGKKVMRRLLQDLPPPNPGVTRPVRNEHPYNSLPDHAFWQQAVAQIDDADITPIVKPRFLIDARDRIATAGSCFAQHVSRHLREAGFRILASEESNGDYDFSARYGNVYTSRQLLQLFDRAFDRFRPQEPAWQRPDGRFCDPFRPRIEPSGFMDAHAVEEARARHLDAVRRMFLELDVFVFTLGLTECWVARCDGAVFPIAPGVAAGVYDPEQHVFSNLHFHEVMSDMENFVRGLREVNPMARILLTVSPVPMVATATGDHVLASNTYSKSVLRAVAGQLRESFPHVEYFPSYEIIAGSQSRGRWYEKDMRSVSQRGIDLVMASFQRHFTSGAPSTPATGSREADSARALMHGAAEALCDEELNARAG